MAATELVAGRSSGGARGRAAPLGTWLVCLVMAGSACSGSDGGAAREAASSTAGATTTGSGSSPGSGAAELPVERTEVAGVAWQGRLAVSGGLTREGEASAAFHTWEPGSDRWTAGPDLPVPLHHHAMATLGDRVYAVGGYSNDPGGEWRSQDGVFSLGPGEGEWREEPSLGRPRGALALAPAGGRLVAVGGVAEGRLTGRVESWAPGEPAWRAGPELLEAREHLAATDRSGRVYAIAGRRGGIDSNLRTVESWAPGERSWRSEPVLGHARGGIGAATVGDRVCVAGGEEPEGTLASVECLASGAEEWVLEAELAVPRHGLAVVALGGRLHVVAGGPRPGLSVSGAHEVLDVG